jgi:DNA-directed RNA polymerase specialized sigma24 family protein
VFALQVAEECERLLACLPDQTARAVALWKVEGYTNDEIAAKLGRSRPTVERKLRLIRATWEEELGRE